MVAKRRRQVERNAQVACALAEGLPRELSRRAAARLIAAALPQRSSTRSPPVWLLGCLAGWAAPLGQTLADLINICALGGRNIGPES